MIILSHRGYWLESNEKNTRKAFDRSFSLGFGTETDIRDLDGKLVISHDMPNKKEQTLSVEDFFDIYKSYGLDLPLALNVKADGLQIELMKLIKQFEIQNYFVFDMAVPDGLLYLKQGFNVFTRKSEYEISPSFYENCDGVWLDEFFSHWIKKEHLFELLADKKRICIVSPELHKRPYESEWEDYKYLSEVLECKEKLMICTDKPVEAKKYFNEN